MARLPRLSAPGHMHLVVQRGHNRQPIALDDEDRQQYVTALREAASHHGVAIHGYAVLDREVLLLATPAEAGSLGRMMQGLGRRYVAAFNRRHGHSGTLWEGRFRNTVVESDRYFMPSLRHVELAPVRAGLVSEPAQYPWSSAAHHLGLARDPLVADHPLYWALGNTPFEREWAYRQWLDQGQSPREVASLQDAALKGWALGSEPFLKDLQSSTGRPATPRAKGRPRK